MDDKTITGVVSVLIAITGLAIIAVLVSSSSKTGSVFGAGGNAISQAICVALSPVTGGSCGSNSLIPSVTSTIQF